MGLIDWAAIVCVYYDNVLVLVGSESSVNASGLGEHARINSELLLSKISLELIRAMSLLSFIRQQYLEWAKVSCHAFKWNIMGQSLLINLFRYQVV
jgi:hypothetical protein